MNNSFALFILYLVSIIRILVGIAPFVVPNFSVARMNLPVGHDNESYRSMFRLFGARDVVLGILTILYYPIGEYLIYLLCLNALVDAGDVVSSIIGIRTDQKMRKSGKQSTFIAGAAFSAWILAIILEKYA